MPEGNKLCEEEYRKFYLIKKATRPGRMAEYKCN
jgi:hypothetical protein